jgi:hypothetical protein
MGGDGARLLLARTALILCAHDDAPAWSRVLLDAPSPRMT